MGDDIRISSDEVMEIARKTRKFAEGLGDNLAGPKKQVPVGMEAVASAPSVPGAQTVIDVHDGANRVVEATLEGVKTDLFDFATSLEKAVEDHHAVDTGIETALKVMIGAFGGSGSPDVDVDVDDDSITDIGETEGPSAGDDARDNAINHGGDL